MAKKNKVSVVFILDRSGSMQDVKESTISGFNEYINTLKNDKESDYRMTLVTFSGDHTKQYKDRHIKEVDGLNSESYRPDGNTALYDAACETLLDFELGDADKALFVIMTDGEENSSRKYTEKDFRNFAHILKSAGRVSFVFLGANQDAWVNAQKWGFDRKNVASYNSTDMGTRAVFQTMAVNTSNYSAKAETVTDSFFSDEDQQGLKSTK